MGYRVLAGGHDVTAEVVVKRSRFRAVLRRVQTQQAARDLLAELRREHHDARHHCSAFVIGPGQQWQRSSDDGEPAGTAGMPMLEVLRGFGGAGSGTDPGGTLSDVAAVVVRWFGGTLLGAGGLVRAYSEAVTTALHTAAFCRREQRLLASVLIDHAEAGRVESALRGHGVQVLGTDYHDQATLRLATDDLDRLGSLVAAVSAGTATVTPAGTTWLDLPEEPT